ncbi:contact-dependent growth inhibition system immunity protein [Actinoplanes sp. NPDC004185]
MADTQELSLEQIEGSAWGDAPADASTLISTVHRLRRRPVGSLDAEDLRILIGQRVGLPVLVSRALGLLQNDPLVEGAYYPGDLLAAVLRVPAEHWAARPQELARLRAILQAVDLDDIDDELHADMTAFQAEA